MPQHRNRLTAAVLILALSGSPGLATPLDDALSSLMNGKVDTTVELLKNNVAVAPPG